MKKIVTYCLIALSVLTASGQTKQTGFKLGLSVLPNISSFNIVSGSNNFINPQSTVTFKQVADSVKGGDKIDWGLGIGLTFMYNIKQDIEFQTGISYSQIGFVRSISNLKFLDPIYPGGPKINDQSTSRTIFFNYRFNYIQVPVMLNFGIPFKNMNFQYNIYGTTGLQVNYYAGSKIKSQFEGFTVNGKDKATFDSTGFNMNKINVNASIGFRFEYLMKNKIILSAQPLLSYNLIPLTKGDLKMRGTTLIIALGVNYRFQKPDDKKKN
jgi:hypothetical protein